MNDCYLCGFAAPTGAALRDHLLTVHPGKKNEPQVFYDTDPKVMPQYVSDPDWSFDPFKAGFGAPYTKGGS